MIRILIWTLIIAGLASPAIAQDTNRFVGEWASTQIVKEGKAKQNKGYVVTFSRVGFDINLLGMQLSIGSYKYTKGTGKDHDRIVLYGHADDDSSDIEKLVGTAVLKGDELKLGFDSQDPLSPPNDLSGKADNSIVFTFRKINSEED